MNMDNHDASKIFNMTEENNSELIRSTKIVREKQRERQSLNISNESKFQITSVTAASSTDVSFPSESNGNFMRCSHCEFEARGMLNLREHIIRTHSQSALICAQCDYIATSSKALRKHTIIHSLNSENKNECDECKFQTGDSNQFLNHIKSHCYVCSYCIYGTNVKSKFISHLMIHERALLKCSHCRYKTNDIVKFKSHVNYHFSGYFKSSDIIISKNRMCSVESKSEEIDKAHRVSQNRKYKFFCSKCNYYTNVKHDLLNHLRTHLFAKHFKCSECTYETSQREYLLDHAWQHFTKNKSLQCGQCDYETNLKHCLTKHQSSHQRSYKCVACSFVTPNKFHCYEHLIMKHGLYYDGDSKTYKNICTVSIQSSTSNNENLEAVAV